MSNNSFGYENSGTGPDIRHCHQDPSSTVEQSSYYRLPQQSQYHSHDLNWQYPSYLPLSTDTHVPQYQGAWQIQSAVRYSDMTTELEPSNGTPMVQRVCTFAPIVSMPQTNSHQHQGSPRDQSPPQGPTLDVEYQTLRAVPETSLRCTIPSCKAKEEIFKSKAAHK
jgi:hypothetical protein